MIGRDCGGGKVERMRGGGVEMIARRKTRDNHGGGKEENDGNCGKKCRAVAITGLGDGRPGPRG